MSDKTRQADSTNGTDDFDVFSKETNSNLKQIDGEFNLEDLPPIDKQLDTNISLEDETRLAAKEVSDKEQEISDQEREIEERFLEEQQQAEYGDVDEDEDEEHSSEQPKVANKKSSNKVLYCITGFALLVGIGSAYVSISALGTAHALQQSNNIYQKQINTIKSQVLEQQQSITAGTASIKTLTDKQSILDDEVNATAVKVAKTDNQITSLQNGYNKRLAELSSDISTITAKSNKNGVEINKIIAAKDLAHKKANRRAVIRRKAVNRHHVNTKLRSSHRAPKVATVNHIGGIRLASIDMWNNHYSATLTTQNGYRVIYPGYNINGFTVQSITPHYVNLMSPNNTLLQLVN